MEKEQVELNLTTMTKEEIWARGINSNEEKKKPNLGYNKTLIEPLLPLEKKRKNQTILPCH